MKAVTLMAAAAIVFVSPGCKAQDGNAGGGNTALNVEPVQPLIDKYVKTGHVSFEFRNFVRDPFDLAASLIARCNGASGFFPLTRALFKDQPTWIAKLQGLPPQQFESLQALGPEQQFREVAQLAGFQGW